VGTLKTDIMKEEIKSKMVYDFLVSHPGITIYWIERALGITGGSIRVRNGVSGIPSKYVDSIGGLLEDYGFSGFMRKVESVDNQAENVTVTDGGSKVVAEIRESPAEIRENNKKDIDKNGRKKPDPAKLAIAKAILGEVEKAVGVEPVELEPVVEAEKIVEYKMEPNKGFEIKPPVKVYVEAHEGQSLPEERQGRYYWMNDSIKEKVVIISKYGNREVYKPVKVADGTGVFVNEQYYLVKNNAIGYMKDIEGFNCFVRIVAEKGVIEEGIEVYLV
jgi:hypothetical protein